MNINVSNHRKINADKNDVFNAIVSEISGDTFWSRPYLYFKSEKATVKYTVGDHKWLYISRFGFPRMYMEATEIQPPYQLKVKYIAGDFVGIAYFSLSDYHGKTDVRFVWHTTAHSLTFKIISFVFPVKYIHWLVVNRVLSKLDKHLKKVCTP